MAVSRPSVQLPRSVSGRPQIWVTYHSSPICRKQQWPDFCSGLPGSSRVVINGVYGESSNGPSSERARATVAACM